MKERYKSTRGHFFIRVHPDGQTFYVFVLDPEKEGFYLKDFFGPYKSK